MQNLFLSQILLLISAITPRIEIKHKIATPVQQMDGSLDCSAYGQDNYGLTVRWDKREADGSYSTLRNGHNYRISHMESRRDSNPFIVKTDTRLTFAYSFDYIMEMMKCETDPKHNHVVCLGEYRCVAEYAKERNVLHAVSTGSISYNFGE